MRKLSTSKVNVRQRRRRRRDKLLERERALWAQGLQRVAGVDEAGVGPLAGPVVAAAVVFPPGAGIVGVDDSKRLGAEQRTRLAGEIRRACLAWAVAAVDALEIDRINIYRAGLEAMRRALEALAVRPDYVLVDGRGSDVLDCPHEAIVGGDRTCHSIAAASILAKTERDLLMRRYDDEFPGYGFAEHKGYPTQEHREAIRRLGPCSIHRRSFTLLPQPRLFD